MRKKPCSICRKWFIPDRRVGSRQKTCSAECREEWRRRRQADWRRRNPEYYKARWLKERARRAAEADRATAEALKAIRAGREPPEGVVVPDRPSAMRMAGELGRLPWDAMQFEIGIEVTDFIAVVSKVLVRLVQSEIRAQMLENTREPPTLQGEATQSETAPVPRS